MSAIKVNEQSSTQHHIDQRSVLAERTQILQTVSRKAQEKTLTLQETNDLFAKFNRTYAARSSSSGYSARNYNQNIPTIGADGVDESWAIKLLKECEQEDNKTLNKERKTTLVSHSKTELYEV